MRAFRVIRLFGRLGSLRDIIAALTAAVVPVLNAFLIMLIVGSICTARERRAAGRDGRTERQGRRKQPPKEGANGIYQ